MLIAWQHMTSQASCSHYPGVQQKSAIAELLCRKTAAGCMLWHGMAGRSLVTCQNQHTTATPVTTSSQQICRFTLDLSLGCTDAPQHGPALVCSLRLALSRAKSADTQHMVDRMTDPEHRQYTVHMHSYATSMHSSHSGTLLSVMDCAGQQL